MSNSMGQAREEWVRERLVARLYEPLPPEEEAQVEMYLREHPELRDYEKKYQEIAKGIDEIDSIDAPFAEEEVRALVSAYKHRLERRNVQLRSRVMRWVAAGAVAASVVGLIFTKGLAVEIGETRITFGQLAQAPTPEDQQFRERITKEVAAILVPVLDALREGTLVQNQRIEEIYRLVIYQRDKDRQEMRNTIERLADLIGVVPRGRIAYAKPLFRTEGDTNEQGKTPDQ